jgi:hypothetical protein
VNQRLRDAGWLDRLVAVGEEHDLRVPVAIVRAAARCRPCAVPS